MHPVAASSIGEAVFFWGIPCAVPGIDCNIAPEGKQIAKGMQLVILDTPEALQRHYPMVSARPVAALRVGIFTLLEWWQALLPQAQISIVSAPYLQVEPASAAPGPFWVVLSNRIPSTALAAFLPTLQPGEALEDSGDLIAFCTLQWPVFGELPIFFTHTHTAPFAVGIVNHAMDWVKANAAHIHEHMALIDRQDSQAAGQGCTVLGSHPVFVGAGAVVEGVIINAREGPVYIGAGALVMEGSLLRGPVAIGAGAVVKMGAQLYGGTTIGPKATAGGEIKNSILGDYSNKAHHGYLGDSMVGQWCNLGAGTSNSNVKNNAGTIQMWSAFEKAYIPVGQKAGMLMGDYSRCAIHTSINSGTVIGLSCSLHAAGFPEKNVPPFTWGYAEKYDLDKALRDATAWMQLKHVSPDHRLRGIFTEIWQLA